jgi:hypothetical protein
MGFQIGEKIKATVKEKTKTTYKFYGGMQCGDLFDCETRVIHSSFDIIGVISIRRKKTGGKVKIVETADGKNYRLDKLSNIVKL